MPHPVEIRLQEHQIQRCREIAQARHDSGGPSRPPDGEHDPIYVDLLGTMSESAVCLAYGYDPEEHVIAERERPKGDYTDLRLFGFRLGVKSTGRFEDPVHLMVPEYDTECDFYFHCSVHTGTGLVWIRGFATREQLLKRPLEEWKWTSSRRGARRKVRRRYIHVDELMQCQPTGWGTVLKLDKSREGMWAQ